MNWTNAITGGNPRWAVFGIEWNGQYMIVASNALAQMNMAMKPPGEALTQLDRSGNIVSYVVPAEPRWEVQTVMFDVKMVVADSWAAGLQKLWAEWSFDGSPPTVVVQKETPVQSRMRGIAEELEATQVILTFRPIKVWPEGWDRTDPWAINSPFSASYASTLELLDKELWHLNASDPVLQVDASDRFDCRIDGQLRADAKVNYRGVILSFVTDKHGTLTYQCNAYAGTYNRPGWQQNLRAIALGLESLRRVERYGIADRGQQYAGWAELPSGIPLGAAMTEEEAWEILIEAAGMRPTIEGDNASRLDELYRLAAKHHHPDQGGDPETFRRIVAARDLLS